MQTIPEILKEINKHRSLSRAQLYLHFKALNIEPAAARQRPQRYPHDTAARILTYLGESLPGSGRLTSMRELKAIKSRSQKVGAR